MTLKEQLKLALGLTEDCFSNHNSDLLILFSDDTMDWLTVNYEFSQNIKIVISDVKGQSWYEKRYIEIPFAYEEYFTKRKTYLNNPKNF